jgi:D-sedoheptulose 7-phosphate isomerase
VTDQLTIVAEPEIDVHIGDHIDGLADALVDFRAVAGRLAGWGAQLARVLESGGRLLVAGNGGSAAEAGHLAGELVGRMRDDRPAYSAIALGADPATLTALGNDYGFAEVFARQVRAHGRIGDVLILLSTSGRSENLLAAARAAHPIGITTWAMTGPPPNPLAQLCDDAVTVPAQDAQTVQELHLVSAHMLCEQFELALQGSGGRP